MKTSLLLLASTALLVSATFIPALASDLASESAPVDLLGRVFSSSVAAITNASIFIYTAGPRQGAGVVCPSCYADCHKSTNTDSAGNFEIKAVSPVLLFQVLVVAPGYVPTFFDKVDPLKSPLLARLNPRPVSKIPPSQTIKGRVLNSRNEPLINAVVSVASTTTGNTTSSRPPAGTDPLDITDEHGEFTIQSPANFDAMDLQVEARGYARQNFPQVHPGLKPADYVVAEGASVRGQVLLNGQPLLNVSVGVAGVDRSMGNFTGDFIFGTDENGRFLFVNLPPNRDYALYGLMDSFHPFGALPVRTIHIGKDGSVTDIGTLAVVPGHELAGRIKLSDNNSIPEHTHLFIGRDLAWDTSTVIELPLDGHFDFTNVPAETVTLSVRVNGYRFSASNLSLDRLNPYGMTGRLDADKTNLIVLLEPGRDLAPDYSSAPDDERPQDLPLAGAEAQRPMTGVIYSGQATDAETGQPLAGFRVTPGLQRGSNRPESVEWYKSHAADSDHGNYSLTLSLKTASAMAKQGGLVLMAQADGYLPVASEPLNAGRTNYNFQLHKGSGPSGVVDQSDGQPAAGVTVIYLAGNQQGGLNGKGELQTYMQGGQTMVTDASGRFQFTPEVGQGNIFTASSRGFGWTTPQALQTNQVMILQPWTHVHGRVVQDGKPVAGENMDLSESRVFNLPILNLHGGVTDDAGRFTIDFVPAGELEISTRKYIGSGHSSWMGQSQRDFTAKPGEHVDLGDVVKISNVQ